MPVADGSRCRCTGSARRSGGGICWDAGAGDGEERRGEHGQDRVAVPGGPAADLVLVEPGLGLGDREGLLDTPPPPGDPDQLAQGGPAPVVAQEVVGVGVGVGVRVGVAVRIRVAADEQAARPAVGAAGRVQGDPGPVRFQNSATVADLRFQAARSYSLISPPSTGRRLIRCWARFGTG